MDYKHFRGREIETIVDYRLKKSEMKPGLYYYYLRHSDDDSCEPISIAEGVLVNLYGTVVLKQPLLLPEESDLTEDEVTLVMVHASGEIHHLVD
jgi:hypothetical protein